VSSSIDLGVFPYFDRSCCIGFTAANDEIVDYYNTSSDCTGPVTSLFYPPYCGTSLPAPGYTYEYNVTTDVLLPNIPPASDDALNNSYYYYYEQPAPPDIVYLSTCRFQSKIVFPPWFAPYSSDNTHPTASPTARVTSVLKMFHVFSLSGVLSEAVVNDTDLRTGVAQLSCQVLNISIAYCTCGVHCLRTDTNLPAASNGAVRGLRQHDSISVASVTNLILWATVNVSLNTVDFEDSFNHHNVFTTATYMLQNMSTSVAWTNFKYHMIVSQPLLFESNATLLSSSTWADFELMQFLPSPTVVPTAGPDKTSSKLTYGQQIGMGVSIGAIALFQTFVVFFCFCNRSSDGKCQCSLAAEA
jgi:hypothetical protein